ncbi:hypothetical protein MHY87_11385 [Microvirga sp. ACRRW]|uniref:hypothetical protein n=1 Tax=Microvirga sp. ACRRW TaxID=2918205 RepID=UPI001EF61311|nr:hypothetical protein [Microvirga sp. ACRRW]MCG7393509.1 hypothetical protein [Microvirga sp. ACRRW]
MAKIKFGPVGYNLLGLFSDEINASTTTINKSSKGFVLQYNDMAQTRVVVKGSDFAYGADGLPTKGTITSWSSTSNLSHFGSASGLKMSAASLVAAAKTWSDTKDDKALFSKILSGNDVITGSSGSSQMHGYGGNDTLIDGGGADELYGGKGADRFVYKSIKGIKPDVQDLDIYVNRIMDFSRSQKDKIDLKAIDANTQKAGNQAFTFIGTKAFTKAGQLRYETDDFNGRPGKTLLGDVNGDGKADFEIFVAGNIKFQTGDFYL